MRKPLRFSSCHPMRWVAAADQLPANQSIWCLLRLRGGLQPRTMYTYNGSAWYRFDGDYDAEESRNPGTIAASDVVCWKDVHADARRKIRRHGELFERGLCGPGSRATIGTRRQATTRAGAAALRAERLHPSASVPTEDTEETPHE